MDMKSPLQAEFETSHIAPVDPAKTTPTRTEPSSIKLDADILKDVQVSLQVKLGHATLSVQELMALKSGSVLKLDAPIADPIELRLNGSAVARGEIVAVGDHFGVRITDIAKAK